MQLVTAGPATIVIEVEAYAVEPFGVTVNVNAPAACDAGTVTVMEESDHVTTEACVPPIVTVPVTVPKRNPVMVTLVPGKAVAGDIEVMTGPAATVSAKVAYVDEPLGVTVNVYVPAAIEAGTLAVMEVSDQLIKVAFTPPIETVPAAVPKFDPAMVIKEPRLTGLGVIEVIVTYVGCETATVVLAEPATVLEESIPDDVYLFTTIIY